MLFTFGQSVLDSPQGVTIDPDSGHIFVADLQNSSIQVFTADGTFLRTIPEVPEESGFFFSTPRALTFGRDGLLYVANSGNDRVQVLTPEGQLLRSFGGPGQGICEPRGICIDLDGNVVLTDHGSQRLQIWSPYGELLRHFDTHFKESEWGYHRNIGVAVTPEGKFIIAENHDGTPKFKVFHEDGQEDRIFPNFSYPWGVTVDKNGLIVVGDDNLKILSKDGERLKSLGTTPPSDLYAEVTPVIDQYGTIYATDSERSRIQVWGVRSVTEAQEIQKSQK